MAMSEVSTGNGSTGSGTSVKWIPSAEYEANTPLLVYTVRKLL